MREVKDRTEGITEGRFGLKLPQREFVDRIDSVWGVYRFINEFWKVNGLYESDSYGNWKPKKDFLELVVPSADNKPLVVVRYAYTPTSEESRLRQKFMSEQKYYDQLITYGYENHRVLVPPPQTGDFEEFLRISYRDARGSTSGSFPEPSVYFHGQDGGRSGFGLKNVITAFTELVS